MPQTASRRSFLRTLGVAAAAAGITSASAAAQEPEIPGLANVPTDTAASQGWQPVSDRRLRVGIVGFGVCRFGAACSFQEHPNVEIVAVSDLFPDRCAELAQVCRCETTYPSLEELVKDDRIEAVFVATDAPSHGQHCMEVLRHGKHVACAVPAVFGSLDEAAELYDVVKASGRHYMMFETSCYHADLHAMRTIYQAGGFGKLLYSEGEYYHYTADPIPSYRDWRVGVPPQWYPTHSNAYYTGVTGGSFTEVSCMGMPSVTSWLQPPNNRYQNPFGTEIALFRTSEGGMSRMAVSWDTPGHEGEMGRVRGQKGSFYGQYAGLVSELPDVARPPLPPSVDAGGHGGSHGYLMNEFVTAVLVDRLPLVNIAWSLNMTVSGVVAHQSAVNDGETMKIPQYTV